MKIDIIYEDDTELASYEANSKGYRLNIHVIINNENYLVNVYSITRLNQDFQTEYEECGYYTPENNLIIVKDVNDEEIKNTMLKLYDEGYFKNINKII